MCEFESQDATKITSASADTRINFSWMIMSLWVTALCLYSVLMTIFLSVSPFSPSVVTMSSSDLIDAGRVSNWYQEPVSEDDEWPGTENQWCPSLDLSYHFFVGPRQLGFMEKMDTASISRTCQFAIFHCSRGG